MTSWLEVGFEGFYGPFPSQNFSPPEISNSFPFLEEWKNCHFHRHLETTTRPFGAAQHWTSIGGEKPEFLHLDNDAKADATTHELQQIDGPLGSKTDVM